MIQGHIEKSSHVFNDTELEILLVSRRRHARGGARFFCRGIDDDGNVGNFVESEMIVVCNNIVHSFVQIRGSIPLFWKQK